MTKPTKAWVEGRVDDLRRIVEEVGTDTPAMEALAAHRLNTAAILRWALASRALLGEAATTAPHEFDCSSREYCGTCNCWLEEFQPKIDAHLAATPWVEA